LSHQWDELRVTRCALRVGLRHTTTRNSQRATRNSYGQTATLPEGTPWHSVAWL